MSLDIYIGNVDSFNFTHNVTNMWVKAGCYDALYMSHGKKASEILPDLRSAIALMAVDPDKYIAMDSPNGWGRYQNALPWLCRVAKCCADNPDAVIEVSK